MHVLSLVVGVVFCRCFVGSTASDTSGFASQAWYVAFLSLGIASVCISSLKDLSAWRSPMVERMGPSGQKLRFSVTSARDLGTMRTSALMLR